MPEQKKVWKPIECTTYGENRKTKKSKSDVFIIKESQRWNVSVLVNLHQDIKMMINVTNTFIACFATLFFHHLKVLMKVY